MNTIAKILSEVKALQYYLYEQCETIFLPKDVMDEIDFENDDCAEEIMRNQMTDEEREWYDLVEGFCGELYNFRHKLED